MLFINLHMVAKVTVAIIFAKHRFKECMSDSVTNYNYVGDTKVSVHVGLSIKKTNANKCTLSEIFLSEILKSFSAFK